MREYGKDKKYDGSEQSFQIATNRVIQYAKLMNPNLIAFHIPNEGKRSIYARISQQGVVKGVSDWIFIDNSKPWNTAFVELKTAKGRVNDNQKAFLNSAESKGYFAAVCWSIDGFMDILKELGLHP